MRYIGRYPVDEYWRRVQVRKQPEEGQVLVCYTDYGGSDMVDIGDLRHFPKDLALASLPPQARECLLSGVQGIDGAWSDEAVKYFKEMVSGKKLLAEMTMVGSMESTDSDYKCSTVRLFDIGMSVARKLIEAGYGIDSTFAKYLQKAEIKDELPSSGENDLDLSKEQMSARTEVQGTTEPSADDASILPLSLPFEVQTPVYLYHGDSPSNFYIQPADTYQLDRLNQLMQKAYTDEEDNHEFHTELKPGMFCAAFSPEDRSWYRAKIVNIIDENVIVNYIDFGNNETIPSGIKPLQKQFLDIPAQAMHCALFNICPITREEGWSKDCIETFMAETGMQRELLVEVQASMGTPGQQGDVNIRDVHLYADGTSVSDILVDAGYAIYSTSAERETFPKFR